jgi:hypothetical protein
MRRWEKQFDPITGEPTGTFGPNIDSGADARTRSEGVLERVAIL